MSKFRDIVVNILKESNISFMEDCLVDSSLQDVPEKYRDEIPYYRLNKEDIIGKVFVDNNNKINIIKGITGKCLGKDEYGTDVYENVLTILRDEGKGRPFKYITYVSNLPYFANTTIDQIINSNNKQKVA